MDIIVQITFWIPLILTVVILLVLFRIELLKGGIKFDFLRKMIFLVLIISVLEVIARVILFYFQLKKSPIGVYLLPSKGTTYFIEKIWQMAMPLVIGVLIGIILLLIVALIRKFSARPFFSEIDQWILFLTGLVAGYPSVLVLITGSLLLMIIFLIFSSLLQKVPIKNERISITPYIIFSAIGILILENFSFYQSFIN